MFRMVWPAQRLIELGYDIKIQMPKQRNEFGAGVSSLTNEVKQAHAPSDTTTIVMQRLTHRYWAQCIPLWRAQGIRVVVDIDDDLSCIHPTNPAFEYYQTHPDRAVGYLAQAARAADCVTVTTPALAQRYRADAVLLPNYLPDHYYGIERVDNNSLMWPASFGTHPNDSEPVGRHLERIVRETGVTVRSIGSEESRKVFDFAFGVESEYCDYVPIEGWPQLLASIGIAFVPLADTKFNEAKSWLKVLELSACGVPWVASPRADYRRFVQLSGHGILARRPGDWHRELSRLATDAPRRHEQSLAGREAAERFRIQEHATKWLQAWVG